MKAGQEIESWGFLIQLLHWTTVLFLIGLFVTGWRAGIHGISSLHLTLGTLLGVVVALRLGARLLTRAPAPLAGHVIVLHVSYANQVVLYLALLGSIATGLATFAPHPFMPHAKLFGAFDLPGIFRVAPEYRRFTAQLHTYLAWILLSAAAVHVVAVLTHVLRSDRAAVRRMARLPRRGSRRSELS